MKSSPNCHWAHYVHGIRFEAVPVGTSTQPRWRLLNRTSMVLLDAALPFACGAARGPLLVGLDRVAKMMGAQAFLHAVNGAGEPHRTVRLMRTGSKPRHEIGCVDVAMPGAQNDVLKFALYELLPQEDQLAGGYWIFMEPPRVLALPMAPAAPMAAVPVLVPAPVPVHLRLAAPVAAPEESSQEAPEEAPVALAA